MQFSTFTNDTALDVGLRLVRAAQDEHVAVTVDIRRAGQQLFHYAMPGTNADNDVWVELKGRVAQRFGYSSMYMHTYLKSLNTTIEAKYLLDPAEFAPHGGAFPLRIRDVGVVGAITVSGLPQEDDHRLVVSVLKGFLKLPD